MDRHLVERYAEGGAAVRRAVAGLSPEQALARPGPGAWSIHQLVVHLMDSDLIGADRMKRVIAEENPTLVGYDETRFVANLFYERQSLDDAVAIVDLNRRQFARVLRELPESAFEREGTHNERGRLTLGAMLGDYVAHLEHHLGFLRAKRERLGLPVR